jgi:hypothetical protein
MSHRAPCEDLQFGIDAKNRACREGGTDVAVGEGAGVRYGDDERDHSMKLESSGVGNFSLILVLRGFTLCHNTWTVDNDFTETMLDCREAEHREEGRNKHKARGIPLSHRTKEKSGETH